jgi:hypothetical protein
MASDVNVTSVVDTTAPTGSVTLTPGASGNIAINLSVTGRQEGTATFMVNRDWTLSGGTFAGANPETFTVAPRTAQDPATTFSATGTVTAAAAQSPGVFTLQVAAFNITNSNTTGGKLAVGSSSTYQVTVGAPSDSTPPVVTARVVGTAGANGWYTSDVTVSWDVTDAQSAAVIDSGCGTQQFTAETAATTSSCAAHSDGGAASSAIDLKIDKTGPAAALSASGTAGANGWYTSAVTVATSGSDSISGPVTCSADQSFTAETAGQSVNGSCTNAAGLSSDAAPMSLKIDLSGPSAVLTPSGTSGANGWYTSNVSVATSGSDTVSGPVTCTAPQTLSTETDGVSVTGSCTNKAGLTTDATAVTVKIDKTNPTAALSASGTLGASGWYTSPVVVSTSGADTVSDPVSCTPDQTFSNDTTGVSANGSCTNDAGLTQAAESIRLKIDQTPPTNVVLSVSSGTAGTHGWYTSNVVVHTSGQDATSGVTCSADNAISVEGPTQVTGHCTNGAGLTTYATPLTVKIDKTPPSASLAVSGTLVNGWYTTDVTVSTSGDDEISAPVICTADQSFAAETAEQIVTGSCINNAGLTTAAAPITIKIDRSGPTDIRFVGGIADRSSFYYGAVPAEPTCTATDALSGFASCVVSGYATTVGTHPLIATATDNAGNTSTATASYTVLPWIRSGFYQPVSMDTGTNRVVNTVKNGSTVPLKFELFAGSTELTNLSAVTGLIARQVSCSNASLLDPVDVLATGGTSLRYDTTAGQFIYNWKTPSKSGLCLDVTMLIADGSGITAHFQLR